MDIRQEMNRLFENPFQQPRDLARWLNLMADWHLKRDNPAGARECLQQIMARFPQLPQCEEAQQRLTLIKDAQAQGVAVGFSARIKASVVCSARVAAICKSGFRYLVRTWYVTAEMLSGDCGSAVTLIQTYRVSIRPVITFFVFSSEVNVPSVDNDSRTAASTFARGRSQRR